MLRLITLLGVGGDGEGKAGFGGEDLCEHFLQAAEAAELLEPCNPKIQLGSVKHGLPFSMRLEQSNEKPLRDQSSCDVNNETILLCFNIIIF